MKSRRVVMVVLALVLLTGAMLLAACGGVEETADVESVEAPVTEPAEPSAPEQPAGAEEPAASEEPGSTDGAVDVAELAASGNVPELVALLGDDDPAVRCQAVEALGDLQAREAVAPLAELVAGDEMEPCAREVAVALGEIGAAEAVKPLLRFPKWTSQEARAALVAIGDPDAILEALPRLGKDGPAKAELRRARQTAFWALGRIGAPSSVEQLLAYGAKWDMRAAARNAVESIGKEAVAPLIDVVEGGSGKVREDAAVVLAQMHAKTAVPALATMLESAPSPVRRTIVVALTEMSAARAREEVLEALLRGGDLAQERWWANHALVVLFRRDVESLLPYLADGETVSEVYEAVIMIGRTGTEGELIDALNRFADVDMAEEYLNCGNEKLEDAARAWAASHGYTVVTGPFGGGGPGWGSG